MIDSKQIIDLTEQVWVIERDRVESESRFPDTSVSDSWIRTGDFTIRYPEGTAGDVVTLTFPALKAQVTATYSGPETQIDIPNGVDEARILDCLVHFLDERKTAR